MKTNDIAAVAVSLNKTEKNKYILQDLGPLGMPSKKKNSIWRDIVPTRGGEGVKNFKMSLLKIPFY